MITPQKSMDIIEAPRACGLAASAERAVEVNEELNENEAGFRHSLHTLASHLSQAADPEALAGPGQKGNGSENGGVWDRERLCSRIEDLLGRDRQFSLVVAGVGDAAAPLTEYSRPLVDDVVKESAVSLAELVGDAGVAGRWEEDVFVAILEGPPAHALAMAQRADQNVSSRYIFQQNGVARTIRVDARACAVSHAPGSPPDRFYSGLAAAIQVATFPRPVSG